MTKPAMLARLPLAIGLLMLAAPSVGAQTGSTAGPPANYTQIQGLSQPSHQTERKVYEVPAFDGINLYVEVEMPKDAPAGTRFPVVLEASPYHGTLADRKGTRIFPGMGNIGLSGYFAPRGYAVAFMDLRGTGRSEGCLDHLGPNDARDLETVIEWLADQPWSNGRIGMMGHSYVGATQVAAAAQNPRGLVTIVPSAGLARMYDHQFQMGVPYNLQWVGPMFAYETLAMQRHFPPGSPAVPVIGGGGTADNFGNDMQYFGCGWPNSSLTAGHGQATGMAQNWHAARDWGDAAARWKGDVFMVHGTNDNAARIPNGEWFFKLRDPRPSDKVWLGQWDHSTSQMGFRRDQWIEAVHAWFDNRLMQRTWTDANGVQHEIDTGPPVEVFVNDSASIGGIQETYTASIWPGPTSTLTLYPNATGNTLSTTAPAANGSASFIAANDGNGRYVEFTSPPLEEDLLLLGPPPNLELKASISGQRLNMVTTLYADTDGFRRAINYCAINPELRNGIYTSTPIVPLQEMLLEPQCFTIGSIVRAGERLVLRVGNTSPHHVSTWVADAQVTVYTGPGKTALEIPVAVDPVLYDDVLA